MTNSYTEKQIHDAIMDVLMERIAYSNYGMLSNVRATDYSLKILAQQKIKIAGNTITQDNSVIYNIRRRYSSKKVHGCHRELKPTLEAVR